MKAIIFDMDGVLINSTGYVTKAFNELLKKQGVKLTTKYRKTTIGRSLRDQIEMWKKDFNITKEIDPPEFSKQAFSIERKLMQKELKPNQDINKLISSAKKKNYKIAVATSSIKERAETILGLLGIRNKLDAFITAEDVEKHKPDPQIFLKTAEELGVDPQDCVVFEDAINGIQAAKKAGMKSIAILTDFTKKEDFEDLADLIIKDFSEADLEILKKL